jgi:XTP/dITP diphosphohydrolase
MKIILSTHSADKRKEFIALVGDLFKVETLPDDFPDIPETGKTLEENARIKAQYVFDRLHQPSLADDTGLEVAALGGAPGIYTARYAGEHATHEHNCEKLLHDLEGKSDRSATFITVICFIDENGHEFFFKGTSKGHITKEYRGTNGFGYDPIFEPADGGGKTFAEMTSEEKNRLSHRSRALNLLLDALSASPKKGTE